MAGRQAKILSLDDLHDLLVFASCTRNPLRNRVLVLLSTKAGLRAGEIANLTWSMVTGASGRISNLMELPDYAAKKGGGRSIPVHPHLAAALAEWRLVATSTNHVIVSERGRSMTPLSIVVWFNRAFKNIGLKGCSSHSGRRTFVTCTRPVGRCAMCNCWPVTGRSKRHNGTSTATPMPSVSWCRSFDDGGKSRSPSPSRR